MFKQSLKKIFSNIAFFCVMLFSSPLKYKYLLTLVSMFILVNLNMYFSAMLLAHEKNMSTSTACLMLCELIFIFLKECVNNYVVYFLLVVYNLRHKIANIAYHYNIYKDMQFNEKNLE